MIVGDTRWKLGQEDSRDDKSDHVSQISQNQRPTASRAVDEENCAELCNQCDDAVDSLILERVVARNTDLSIDGDGIILDG